MPDFPNIAATGTGPGLTPDLAGFIAPGQVGIGNAAGGSGAEWASLSRDDLNALIQYRNAQLAQQNQQFNGQQGLANRQLDMQGTQFGQQLSFNADAQRASELQAAQRLFFDEQTQRAKQRAEDLDRAQGQWTQGYGIANQSIGLAQQEALARQGLSLQGYGQAEQARQAQQAHALGIANLMGSLRGPSNAFKQLEVNGYLNQNGQNGLLGALAGEAGVPSFRAPGAEPEAASIATMARDAGATPYVGQGPSAYTDTAGIQGMLQVASQNAAYTPTDPGSGNASRTYSTALDQVAADAIIAAQSALGPDVAGPSSTVGSKLIKGYQQLLATSGESYIPAHDVRLIDLYRSVTGMTDSQARVAARYANDYYSTYRSPMNGSMLNEMVGQIMDGQQPDLMKWSDGAKAKIPGWGTPGFLPPPRPYDPNAPPVAAPGTPGAPPVPGGPPLAPNPNQPQVPIPGGYRDNPGFVPQPHPGYLPGFVPGVSNPADSAGAGAPGGGVPTGGAPTNSGILPSGPAPTPPPMPQAPGMVPVTTPQATPVTPAQAATQTPSLVAPAATAGAPGGGVPTGGAPRPAASTKWTDPSTGYVMDSSTGTTYDTKSGKTWSPTTKAWS